LAPDGVAKKMAAMAKACRQRRIGVLD